ncbi:hypothetical protein HMPREF1869_01368 [Bacteroidales bacterium KA00251]|nr:hypothetical protein HMPREF1869_01368 [Bacteroidales bacterium KA00251]
MKVYKKVAVAALMLWGMLACTGKSPKEVSQHKMDYPVSFSLEGNKTGLRAEYGSSSLSASFDNERAIENLTIFVFTNNSSDNVPATLEKVIVKDNLEMPAGGDAYSGAIKFDMGMSGTYYLEIVANAYKEDPNPQGKDAFLSNFRTGMSYEAFKGAVFSRDLPQHGETGFAMLTTEPVKVTTARNQTSNAGAVKLRRLACRFDVFNKLVGDLVLTKATLNNVITKSYMMTANTIPSGSNGGEKSYDANNDWFTSGMITGGIYSYENPSLTPRTTLLLEGTYKGKPWKKTIEFKKEGQSVNMLRNHIYRVYLTKGNGTTPGGGDHGGGGKDPSASDKVHYVIKVLDWDEESALAYEDQDLLSTENQLVDYTLYADNNRTLDNNLIPEKGGELHVTCIKRVYFVDSEGRKPTLYEKKLLPNEFKFTLKEGDASQISYDEATGNFKIVPGQKDAIFKIEPNFPGATKVTGIVVQRIMNPLRYVAEFNVNEAGDGFVTDKVAGTGSGHFDFNTSKTKFENIEINGEKYHLPKDGEWASIVLTNTSGANLLFTSDVDQTVTYYSVNVAKNPRTIKRDQVKGWGNNVCYALRFRKTAMQSAWKYEYVVMQGHKVLRITSRNVEDGVTITDIAKESFWQQNSDQNIVRIFPANGKIYSSGEKKGFGTDGCFWSLSTIYTSVGNHGCSMDFDATMAASKDSNDLTEKRAIRLFKDVVK